MSSEARLALLGAGGWGKNWARTLHSLEVLHTVCDLNPAILAEVQKDYPKVRVNASIDETLSHPEIDAVVLATPPSTHAELALKAFRNGKDVLVEKPMALTVKDGAKLVEEAEKHQRVFMVGHVLEYHPAVTKIRELLTAGQLGRLYSIHSNRLNLGRIRTEENALWSFAPHDIAIILRLCGEFPERVACQGGAYLNPQIADTTSTHMTFPSGTHADISASWLYPFKEHKLVVVGSKQMAVFDDLKPWESKLQLFPHQVDWVKGKVPMVTKAEPISVPLQAIEPLKEECLHFLECIRTRNRPLTDGASGLQVLKVLALAQSSLDQKGVPQNSMNTVRSDVYVHPSATVDPEAKIGEGTKIWHYSHVMKGALLGKNCVLGQNVFVAKNAVVGNGVKVQNNVSLYEGVVLEDHVFCGPSMVFTNVMNPRSHIERKNEFRKTVIRKGATLGANSTIVCGHEVGHYAFVGAGAVVTRNVPDFALVVGAPAKIIGWVCQCGERLTFEEDSALCKACRTTYTKKGITVYPTEAAGRVNSENSPVTHV